MILPHPESDLNLNLMVLGSEIIAIMRSINDQGDFILTETILNNFLKGEQKRTPDLFVFSLVFLYSVGLIEREGYKIKLSTSTIKSAQTTEQINLFS